MNHASSIVRSLLEDEHDDLKSDAIEMKRLMTIDQRRGLDPTVDHEDTTTFKTISFGFAIRTSHEDMIKEHAAELGLELNDRNWEQVNKDIERLERNIVALLNKHGIDATPEGHDNNGDLIGSASVKTGTPAWEWVSKWEDDTEPLSTTSGTLTSVEGAEKLFDGVSEMGQRILDVDVGFFDLGEVHAFRDGLPTNET